ncbi:hypothetical protein [Rhizobium yanglingense]
MEWAEVHGNFYGTPREPVEAAMAEGRDMLFDIDWQGAQQLQEKMSADVRIHLRAAADDDRVAITASPPCGRFSEEVGAARLADSRAEIAHWREYDYVIVNDDLDTAFDAVQAIVGAERLRRDRRHGIYDFVTKLLEETPVL